MLPVSTHFAHCRMPLCDGSEFQCDTTVPEEGFGMSSRDLYFLSLYLCPLVIQLEKGGVVNIFSACRPTLQSNLSIFV